jgi:hypothetical protein
MVFAQNALDFYFKTERPHRFYGVLVPAFAFKICVFLDLLFSRAGRDLARLEVCSFEVLFGVQQESQRVRLFEWPGDSPAA